MRPRIAVLLGAGASVDAGLPVTSNLAEQVVRKANEECLTRWYRPDWLSALNFVYGAMVGYQSEDGGNPLSAVNIEQLISALRILRRAKTHEVAPFVSAWKSPVTGKPGSQITDRHTSKLLKAQNQENSFFASFEMVEALQTIFSVALESDGVVFEEAESKILPILVKALSGYQSTDYLQPLIDLAKNQFSGLDIITLNYDLTIEDIAQKNQVSLDVGVNRYKPGHELTFSKRNENINLFKLHGSLNWKIVPPDESKRRFNRVQIEVVPFDDSKEIETPWIVVGNREKLATNGPILSLIYAAESALRSATHLVIVGYSFSDEHVNSLILDWIEADESRKLIILDQNWNEKEYGTFKEKLLTQYNPKGSEERVIKVIGTAGRDLRRALQIPEE